MYNVPSYYSCDYSLHARRTLQTQTQMTSCYSLLVVVTSTAHEFDLCLENRSQKKLREIGPCLFKFSDRSAIFLSLMSYYVPINEIKHLFHSFFTIKPFKQLRGIDYRKIKFPLVEFKGTGHPTMKIHQVIILSPSC